jgi:hypothetical protein
LSVAISRPPRLVTGFVHVRERFPDKAAAWDRARAIVATLANDDAIGGGMPPLEVVGEFTIPPPGALRRDFQTLHIDFGLPLGEGEPHDVARFTALYVDAHRPPTTALTRIVPLPRLLAQRSWPAPHGLARRLRAAGGAEGILARLVEAADERPSLPVGVLCGMEFSSLAGERAFFARHGLELDPAERRVALQPGELLVFDNLLTAHGRTGTRATEELHQLCLGYRGLDGERRTALLDRVLGAFAEGTAAHAG